MTALSPRQKLMTAGGLSALLTLAAALSSGSITTGSRIIIGASSLAGFAAWALRRKEFSRFGQFSQAPRLRVVQKIGLSPRTGVALLEVDGRSFLVIHGDTGTRIRRVASRAAVVTQPLRAVAS
jgi:flagellar protein FliO/FliZ